MTSVSSDRLLARDADGALLDLRQYPRHIEHFGPLPAVQSLNPDSFIDEVGAARLRGRGGGWFPTAQKLRAVRESAASRRGLSSGKRPVVVANAMEGEPSAQKDALLISTNPHLVLDGIQVAAAAVGARLAFIAIHRGSDVEAILDRALAERRDAIPIELVTPPARYVASEESALSHWIGEGLATPTYGTRPFASGVRGRPTLVLNAETMAHLALIARFGGAWFAQIGDPEAPGTTLVSISGAVRLPGVLEVPTGTPVAEIIERAGGLTAPVRGFLTGGYGGAWVEADRALATTWSPEALRAIHGVLGAGVLVALPSDVCPLEEVARVTQWMAGESAGQCGPCRFGLPALAEDLRALALRTETAEVIVDVERHAALVSGRGGCKHPDGAARFVTSAMRVFADEVSAHGVGRCSATSSRSVLPVPHGRATPVSLPGKDLR